MRLSDKDYTAYYRELADKLEQLTRLAKEGSGQNFALIERLSQLTAEMRKDVGEVLE